MKIVERILSFAGWSIIIGLSVYFFLENIAVYFMGFRSSIFTRSPVWVALHLIGGSLVLITGPLQFAKWIRARYVNIHRVSGKIYIISAFVAGVSALRLSIVSPCVPCRVSLFILAMLTLGTTFSAWWAIKRRNITIHRQFMVRSYICAIAFVGVRIGGLVPLDFLFGPIPDATFDRTVNEYFFSFVPIIAGEIFMIWIPSLLIIKSKERITPEVG
ncbi:MAG TPA: DUF2306 domain-containing protein [Chryseolinea sp.]|nr:DUF2306 domain-containing protein [Chryseolinea sp.]